MSNDLNHCSFIGRLGADPESRFLQSGKAVTNIRIAVGSSWKDKASGEKKESTEWVPVVFFDKLAEIAAQYLTKGSQVFVSGRFQTRSWEDKEGNKRYSSEIIADQMQMLGGKSEAAPTQPAQKTKPAVKQAARQAPPAEDFDDSIPWT